MKLSEMKDREAEFKQELYNLGYETLADVIEDTETFKTSVSTDAMDYVLHKFILVMGARGGSESDRAKVGKAYNSIKQEFLRRLANENL